MTGKPWWNKQLRIIQYNLQFKDTQLMNAAKIAKETKQMGGNVVVINASDSVVWYRTASKFHKVNEYLPEGRDLLEEIITECHKQDIKVIARISFMAMEEEVYYKKPQWAARKPDGSPITLGNDRPGKWNTLYVACPNGGYRNLGVSMDITTEIYNNYDFDGAFFCGVSAHKTCWCDTCRNKYFSKYGKSMPERSKDFEPDWLSTQSKESSLAIKDAVLSIKPDMPYLRYYWPFDLDIGLDIKIHADNISEISKEGNTLTTEAQDVLSMGVKGLHEWNTPSLRMKMGRTMKDFPPPVGIIHTCPGMDWRHSCMPKAEFMYWASQIPANGGSYWTTFTGFADTIEDKRMLKTIGELNKMTEKIVDDMEDANSLCEVMLLSDGGTFVQGWAEALMCAHIDFDMLAHYQLSYDAIKKYSVVIVPKDFKYPNNSKEIFDEYVGNGGKLIIEGTDDSSLAPVKELIGAKDTVVCSEDLAATYLRIEEAGKEIQDKIGESYLTPLRGKVGFYEPYEDSEILVTWVPPFAPVNYAGRPPERASLPAAKTDIPLCTVRDYKKGKVMYISYEPSRLVMEYAMQDMYTMIKGYAEYMLKDDKKISLDAPNRIIMTVFEKERSIMVHLVNGVGQRPLQDNIPCRDIKLCIKLDGRDVAGVVSKIEGCKVEYKIENDVLTAAIPILNVWDMLKIELRD